MANEKLALTPYDMAVLTAVAQGGASGVNRAQHPERAGEPALERGIGQGLTATLGHAAAALPTAYLTRNLGGLASGTLATLAGLAGGAAAPWLANKAGQVGHDMTGGHVRMAAAALAKLGAYGCEEDAGSMGDKACSKCKKVHKPGTTMCAKEADYTQPGMQPLSSSVSMSAAAQPPPGSEPGMGDMGSGFSARKPKKPKESPMKAETKSEEKKEEGTEKEAAEGPTFMSGFMDKWRKTSGKDMAAKVALFRGSGFGSAMKRNAA